MYGDKLQTINKHNTGKQTLVIFAQLPTPMDDIRYTVANEMGTSAHSVHIYIINKLNTSTISKFKTVFLLAVQRFLIMQVSVGLATAWLNRAVC